MSEQELDDLVEYIISLLDESIVEYIISLLDESHD